MRLAEDMIKYIISYVLEHAPEEMAFFNQFLDKGLLDRLNNVLNNDFGRITYTDAVALLTPTTAMTEATRLLPPRPRRLATVSTNCPFFISRQI